MSVGAFLCARLSFGGKQMHKIACFLALDSKVVVYYFRHL
jgi:energy-coupling factor transporter ATP-binding protein EcfA2